MATVNNFEDLSIWQKSRDICQRVFKFTEAQPSAKDFTFKDQIRRSSGSIMDNIAEGFGRQGSKEFIQFLSIAQGSCAEVQSQLYRALDQKYIIEKDFNEIFEMTKRVQAGIIQLSKYLKSTSFKGTKFSNPEPKT